MLHWAARRSVGRRAGGFEPRGGLALARSIAPALCSLAFLTSRIAAADDFSDFRIPSNRALLWTAALSTRAGSADLDQPPGKSSSGDLQGTASTRFLWFSDSDPAFTSLAVDAAAQGNRLHRESSSELVIPTGGSTANLDESSDRQMFERWGIAASHRSYPWAMPLGFEASLRLSGDYSQEWHSRDRDDFFFSPGFITEIRQGFHSSRWRYDQSVVANAAAGWGRVRNATGIYDALVLEQRLRETGALTRALSPAGRMRLAEVLYMRGALDTVRERPGRFLWREIERVLAEDGALHDGGLDPYSVLRATEPHLGGTRGLTADGVPISPVTRQTGFFVGARLTSGHAHRVERVDAGTTYEAIENGSTTFFLTSTSSAHSTNDADQVQGAASGEFHMPMGPEWQLDGAGVAALSLRKEDNHMIVDSQLSLAWLAADRWTAIGSTSYAWLDEDRTEGPTADDRWNWNFGLGVNWYVEERTAIQFSASERQFWLRGTSDPGTHFFIRSLDAALSVTYRFSGWIATPGFFPAATAGPPLR